MDEGSASATRPDRGRQPVSRGRQVEFTRARLRLSADRDPEITEALAPLPEVPRARATIWWDVDQDDDRSAPPAT